MTALAKARSLLHRLISSTNRRMHKGFPRDAGVYNGEARVHCLYGVCATLLFAGDDLLHLLRGVCSILEVDVLHARFLQADSPTRPSSFSWIMSTTRSAPRSYRISLCTSSSLRVKRKVANGRRRPCWHGGKQRMVVDIHEAPSSIPLCCRRYRSSVLSSMGRQRRRTSETTHTMWRFGPLRRGVVQS